MAAKVVLCSPRNSLAVLLLAGMLASIRSEGKHIQPYILTDFDAIICVSVHILQYSSECLTPEGFQSISQLFQGVEVHRSIAGLRKICCVIGGLMDFAYSFIIQNGGIDTEKDYKYHALKGQCNVNKENRHVVTIDGYEDVPPNDEIALAKVT